MVLYTVHKYSWMYAMCPWNLLNATMGHIYISSGTAQPPPGLQYHREIVTISALKTNLA